MNAPTRQAFLDLVNLAAARLGAVVVSANDDFFAPKENLIKAESPIWAEGKYTDRGKWMDGWETRRRREPGHDWCVVRLGLPGAVMGVDVDTAFFTGNFPEACAIDVCHSPASASDDDLVYADWREVLPATNLEGGAHNVFAVDADTSGPPATHVRLRIFPDGGVARLRVYGYVLPDWAALRQGALGQSGDVDLAAVEHGGLVIGCSDMFFGSRHNLIMPGEALNMGDGWETKRRRGPGHDWTIVRLGSPGLVRRVEMDTRHFKGNAPGAFSLEGCSAGTDDVALGRQAAVPPGQEAAWKELLPRTPLAPDARHDFKNEVRDVGDVTHVRLNIYPDGGVARLRLYGTPRILRA